jgi:hypothetical protein
VEGEAREAVVDLTLAEGEGADERTFGRVSGVVVDQRGRIYVADASANEVRVFAPDGRFLYRIGRQGQGPGEFDGPCCLALRDDDRTLWVRDGGNARYTTFNLGDSGAVYRSAIRMAHTDINRWAPVTFDQVGNLIDIGSLPMQPGAAGTPRMGRFHIDSTGRVVRVDTIPNAPLDSVPVHLVPGASGITFYLSQPFGPFQVVAHSSNGEWARAVTSRYSVAWHGADGRVLRTIDRVLEGPPLTAAERGRAQESLDRDMKRTGLAPGALPYGIPDRKQPLRDLLFDQDGRLWVLLSVPEGTASRADVYDREGRLTYRVSWPPRTDLTAGATRADVIHAVQRDSLDRPAIVRMKLTTPAAGGER